MRIMKILIRLRGCAGWFESSLGTHVRRYVFSRCGPGPKNTWYVMQEHITKTCLHNFDPLKPHFNIVKLVFTVYIMFSYFCSKNIDRGYSLEPPRRGGSNEYQQSVFSRNMKNIRVFYLNIFLFLKVKFSIYLNRRVFVMIFCIGMLTLWP